ncbi:methyltransferase domain-containing protein [Paenibacillus sp. MMS20-IR301]|uniref:class I SAM-dependent methyltransferase n=1 Tax=Paenibacillus sp. MMS20-IR301 TaxID=2895946 RepID=UPI0028EEC052|nr:methyltransferase domain-containing protein [Paenibacillus sp. MMS20-IR301]WNS43114.1 methyltransferase domain-containing protein [Paenibacillus sp. MMS20-IR301]
MNIREHLLFLRGFLRDPLRVGSILPSSPALAETLVRCIPWAEIHSVAELGAGTGTITRLIDLHRADSSQVFLFERNKTMRTYLKERFPAFMFHSNASYLLKKLNDEGVSQLDCILCGLPFFNFSDEMRERLLHQIVQALKPGGYFVAYRFSLQMKKHFAARFTIERVEFVGRNFPPAYVYVCRKPY